jgi:demethylmenaquinone methyltransferase/2-methoxy-6-polyprenyl-1,4-benzoquinol methylase
MLLFLGVFLLNSDATHLIGVEQAHYVHGIFSRIGQHYDLMNRLMTFGQDVHWRRETIKIAELPPGDSLLLDLGGGTGALGFEARKNNPGTISIEADFSLQMMRIGRERRRGHDLHWSAVDALILPFPDDTFDAVVSGFLLRNVADLSQSLKEQYRVIKPGGKAVALDTTSPQTNLLMPLLRFYIHTIIPLLGRFISGQVDAYKYLADSSEKFLSAEKLAAQLGVAGFGKIGFERFNFGTIAIHWGVK